VNTHKVQSAMVIRAIHKGGHLEEYMLVQRLRTLEVLWRIGSELPEASNLEITMGP
jgi:hypothetical protein